MSATLFASICFLSTYPGETEPVGLVAISDIPDYDKSEMLCGPIAVWYALHDRGSAAPFSIVVQTCNWTPLGSSLSDLQSALQKNKVASVLRKLSKQDLLQLKTSAILTLNRNNQRHYVYLKEIHAQKVLLLDFPATPHWLNFSEIADDFTGDTIIILDTRIRRDSTRWIVLVIGLTVTAIAFFFFLKYFKGVSI